MSRIQVQQRSARSRGVERGAATQTLRRCGGVTCPPGTCDHHDGPVRGTQAPSIVYEVVRSLGQPLDPATRAYMEPRLGHDFGKVRIHTGRQAADSARAVEAKAYTVGHHVVLGAGHESVQSTDGRELLAHELTHVVQQSSVSADLAGSIEVGDPSDVAEREADKVAHSVDAHSIDNGDIGVAAATRLQRAGDLSAVPPTMSCPVATTSPASVTNRFGFPRASSTLTAAQKLEIATFVQNWRARGGSTPVRVDGYASVDGPQSLNWTLSCDRARAIERELLSPFPGLLPGVPPGLITLFAHGETDEYGTAVDNRQASITTSAPARPAPAPAPAPPAAPAFTVTVPSHIRSARQPAGTPDRIPPRADTPVDVKVSNWTPPMLPVTLAVEGSGAGNGTATIDGSATTDVSADTTAQLRGVTQTDPGKAGNLRLVARQGPTVLARSGPFSVAAWPIEIGFNFNAILSPWLMGGTKIWGASYDVTFVSDSKVNADCDKTKISENVLVQSGTGVFAATPTQSSFFTTTIPQTDHHGSGTPTAADMKDAMDAAGVTASMAEYHQFFRFSCERSGIAEDRAAGPKIPTSGFKITHATSGTGFKLLWFDSRLYYVHAQKEGFANNSVAAGAVDDVSVKKAEVKD
jgi:outer membrane protein OmpA-like peptidoglycan-associated protein